MLFHFRERPPARPATLRIQTMLISQRVSSIYKSIPRGCLVGAVSVRVDGNCATLYFSFDSTRTGSPPPLPEPSKLLSYETLLLPGTDRRRRENKDHSPTGVRAHVEFPAYTHLYTRAPLRSLETDDNRRNRLVNISFFDLSSATGPVQFFMQLTLPATRRPSVTRIERTSNGKLARSRS